MIAAEGYEIKDGHVSGTDAPGFGLSIDEAAFAREAEIRFDVKV